MLNVSYKKESVSDILMLELHGELEFSEKERVLSLLPQVLKKSCRRVLLNLTNISFMDSAGVEVLIRYYVELKKAGIRFVVVTSDNNYLIKKFRNLGIFDGTGLEFFETVEEAKSALATS